jgi:hypothetical protein
MLAIVCAAVMLVASELYIRKGSYVPSILSPEMASAQVDIGHNALVERVAWN